VGRDPQEGELPPGAIPARENRRGPKKAIVAVAASMLTAAYFMLRDGVEYHVVGIKAA
jgi:hypothetical protein